MALSLDDRLLGEKTQYYCSSSEDEGTESDREDRKSQSSFARSKDSVTPVADAYTGRCTNVGFSTNILGKL